MAAALLVGGTTLVPVWASPVLATNDGPSHVYNAALADGVGAGRAPFATYFQLEGGLRPNIASQVFLVFFGPRLGWDVAERTLVTLALVGTFAVVLALVAPRGPVAGALLAPLAGWLATSWFVWRGSYDFVLSVPCYAGLLLALRSPRTRLRDVAVLALLGLLYLTHFFTFAAGIALVIAVLGWRAVVGSDSWGRVGIALPAVALLAIEMASGGPGTGAVLWGDRWDALRGLMLGDFAVSATPLDVVGGGMIMAGVWAVAALRWGAVRRAGLRGLAGEEVFGFALLLLSLVAPDGVGEGTYIPIRMRYLGVLALVPAMAHAAATLRASRLAVLATALAAALGVHSTLLVGEGVRAARNVMLIDRLLMAAGARQGSWVATRFTTWRRGWFRAAGDRHLIARVAVRRSLVVLDNYEALYGVFATVWRARPDWIWLRPSTRGFTVRLAPGSIPWPGGVFVLHESDRVLHLADPRLALGGTASGGWLAVTLVRRKLDSQSWRSSPVPRPASDTAARGVTGAP